MPNSSRDQIQRVELLFGRLTFLQVPFKFMVQAPREKTDRWSQVFRRVQSLARLQDIAEYAVSQSSLEETFLRLADTEEDTVTV